MNWLPLIGEVFVFLLALAGAMGVLKKGQADMEKNLSLQRADLKKALDDFHVDLSHLSDTVQRLDKHAAVNQVNVDRIIQDSMLCRTECQTEMRRQIRAITAIEIWRAAVNQHLRQADPAWSTEATG